MRETTRGARLRAAGGRGLRGMLALCLAAAMAPAVAPVQQARAASKGKEATGAAALGTGAFARHVLVRLGKFDGEDVDWQMLPNAVSGAYEGPGNDCSYIGADGKNCTEGVKGNVALMMSEYTLKDRSYGSSEQYWQDSDIHTWLSGDFLEGFSRWEKSSMLKTTKASTTSSSSGNAGSTNDRLSQDQVFLLDSGEIAVYAFGYQYEQYSTSIYHDSPLDPITDRNGSQQKWWVRDGASVKENPGLYIDRGGTGTYIDSSQDKTDVTVGVRPCFSLNMKDVAFTLPAGDDGSVSGLKANEKSALRLALRDESRSDFAVTQPEGNTGLSTTPSTPSGKKSEVSVSYSGAQTGEDERITAMVVKDKGTADEQVLYWGHVAKVGGESSGTATVEMPDYIPAGDYKLVLYNEKVGGEHKTSVASEPQEVDLHVDKRDPVAADFTCTLPTGEPAYDGGPKAATLAAGKDVPDGALGAVTAEYYGADGGKLDSAPKDAGTYTVKASVTGGTACDAGTTEEGWTFTIAKAPSQTEIPGGASTSVTYGDKLTLTANVSRRVENGPRQAPRRAPGQEPARLDEVAFYAGGKELGTASVEYGDAAKKDSGTATLSLTVDRYKDLLEIGDNAITAAYNGSVNLLGNEGARATVNLAAKEVDLEWNVPDGLVYGDGDKRVTAAVRDGELVAGDEVSVDVEGGDAGSRAGSRTATASLSGAQKDRYAIKAGDETENYGVARATPRFGEGQTVALVASGKPLSSARIRGVQALGVDNRPLSGSYAWADGVDRDEVPEKGEEAVSRDVTFTPDDADNYGTATAPARVVVFAEGDLGRDTDGNGRPDLNVDKDGDGIPDANVDIDGDDLPDLDLDPQLDPKGPDPTGPGGDGPAGPSAPSGGDDGQQPRIDIDTDGDGKPDLNVDTDRDGRADLNVDTDGDGRADLNIDTDKDGKADLNLDVDGDGKADLNIDTDGDGKADTDIYNKGDLNVDTDKDGKPDLNIDTDGDGKADLNIDTDGDARPDLNVDTDKDGKADLNVDTNKDGKADLNVDTDGDGRADLNVDTDKDGVADLNLDVDGDGKADLNIDTDGDGKPDTDIYNKGDLNVDYDHDGRPDLNIDTDGDGKADLNIDVDGDARPDLNVDTDRDGKADLNIDTDGDGKPDLNIDVDGDGKPDLNIDVDGDGKPDLNIDTDGDGKPDLNVDTDGDGKADRNVIATGKVSGTLLAKVSTKGKRSQTLAWTAVKGADGYDVWFAKCGRGESGKYRRVARVGAKAKRSLTRKGLKAGATYKWRVTAWRLDGGKRRTVRRSLGLHSIAGGSSGKVANATAVKAGSRKVTLKAGRGRSLGKVTVAAPRGRAALGMPHAPRVRYLSTNAKVVSVSGKGRLEGKKRGTATVYAIAANGVRTSVKVTVR